MAHLLRRLFHTRDKGGVRMQETREKVVLTALLLALLVVLAWIGMTVTARSQAGKPIRYADAQWTMTHTQREDAE